MDLITRIRTQSSEIHSRLESVSGMSKIMDGSITVDEYHAILLKNYRAYRLAETHISSYTSLEQNLSERIKADLPTDLLVNNMMPLEYSLFSLEEALGALYVVTGSTLGAAVISKNLDACSNVNKKERHFYRKPSKEERHIWPNLLKKINGTPWNESQQNQILAGVMKTFHMFEAVYESTNLELIK